MQARLTGSGRIGLVIAVLMLAASAGAVILQPKAGTSEMPPLEGMVPRHFGDWREDHSLPVRVVNAQAQQSLDQLYSQVLTRVYVNADGYRVMMSLVYGGDQRGGLQAHKPEVCYPAQGFVVQRNEARLVKTSFGEIPARRLLTAMQSRREPLTYWFTVGDRAVEGRLHARLVELRLGLTGRIPDGMLFRVSSLDKDDGRAYRVQEQFINDLLHAVPAATRKRLSGLDST